MLAYIIVIVIIVSLLLLWQFRFFCSTLKPTGLLSEINCENMVEQDRILTVDTKQTIVQWADAFLVSVWAMSKIEAQ